MQSAQGILARLSARRLRPLGTCLVAGVVLSTSGCGGGATLERLTATQRDQLDAAWTARISATDPASINGEARNARAKALYTACQSLDRSQPYLASLVALCGPTASRQKLAVLLPERCATPSALCTRALDRIAEAAKDEGTRLRQVSAQARQLTDDQACVTQLAATSEQLQGYDDLAAAYRVISTGIERDDNDIAGYGQRRVDDAEALITPRGTIAQRTARFRRDCMDQG